MARYTDHELMMAFSTATPPKTKRFMVNFTPVGNAPSQTDGDQLKYFSAVNKKAAEQIASEYGYRFLNARVRFVYLDK